MSTRSGSQYSQGGYGITTQDVDDQQPLSTDAYMSYETVQYAYEEIQSGEPESVVDDFWLSFLPTYFKAEEGFRISTQTPPKKGSKKKTDVMIRKIIGGKSRRVLIIEDKAPEHESNNGKWSDAKVQLTKYMLDAAKDNKKNDPSNAEQRIYGIVTIGKYSRIFVLMPGKTKLSITSTYGDYAYHFNNDATRISQFLEYVRGLFSPHNSPANSAGSSSVGAASQAASQPTATYQAASQPPATYQTAAPQNPYGYVWDGQNWVLPTQQ